MFENFKNHTAKLRTHKASPGGLTARKIARTAKRFKKKPDRHTH